MKAYLIKYVRSRIMKEAILAAPISWEGVDLLECCRYVALNWTEDQCRKSKLRRILPRRRFNNRTKPLVKVTGPRGKYRGDSEQWIFPRVKIEEWEKFLIELSGTVIEMKHYYNFGGKTYK